MKLKEKRKELGLTQKEAAKLVGISYRTYVRYEEDESYVNSYKYKKILEDLNNKTIVDEEHGILDTLTITKKVLPILEEHNINYCYLFGSYARGEAKENSDVDLLIDTSITGLNFYSLIEKIRASLKKKVDLVRLSDLQNDNPLALAILKEGIRIR